MQISLVGSNAVLVEAYGLFRDSYCLILRPDDGSNGFVYKYGVILPDYTALHSRWHVFRIVNLFLHSTVHKSKCSLGSCLLFPAADTTQNTAALFLALKEATFCKYNTKVCGPDSGCQTYYFLV